MIKVFFLILEPDVTWDKIAQAKRGFLHIVAIHLFPLLLLTSLLEAWGLNRHGKWQPKFQMYYTGFSGHEILCFEVIEFLLFLAVVFISALLVFKITQPFQYRLTFLQVFTTMAYGFTPMFLIHFLDASAAVNPLVPWLLGMGLAMWVLYQGIPRVMQPDPTHAFGVYLSTMFVVLLTSGLARLITGMYLLGYMDYRHSWLSHKLIHLLGQ
jgi:hypothetical protein